MNQVIMCENVRFNEGEKANDKHLAKRLAGLGDLFVMDAFACAHRAHASSCGAIVEAKQACAGPLMEHELASLSSLLDHGKHPIMAIIGGAKISGKFTTLKALLSKVDVLMPVGGIANTLLASQGYQLGRSLVEQDWLLAAQELLQVAQTTGTKILMPCDVVCATDLDSKEGHQKMISDIAPNDMIVDIGEATIKQVLPAIARAQTLIWSGPVGVFENPAFAHATETVAKAIADSQAKSVVGGGDTLAAIAKFGVGDAMSYISTGGSAFLQFLEGRPLPALTALQDRERVLQ